VDGEDGRGSHPWIQPKVCTIFFISEKIYNIDVFSVDRQNKVGRRMELVLRNRLETFIHNYLVEVLVW
jgi:hypothetical protein